jgi:threonine/homoserine/homoserine lactone efflux protein
MTTVDWLAFVPIALGISLVPGANQLLGLRNSYRNGLRTAMIAVSGRLAAFAIMIVLVAVGLGAVLVQSEIVFSMVKWAGVAYLFYLGLRSLWSSWQRPVEPNTPVGTDPTPGEYERPFARSSSSLPAIRRPCCCSPPCCRSSSRDPDR